MDKLSLTSATSLIVRLNSRTRSSKLDSDNAALTDKCSFEGGLVASSQARPSFFASSIPITNFPIASVLFPTLSRAAFLTLRSFAD